MAAFTLHALSLLLLENDDFLRTVVLKHGRFNPGIGQQGSARLKLAVIFHQKLFRKM